MTLLQWLTDRLVGRYSERSLAQAIVVLVALLVASQLFFVWYFGSVGLSLQEMGNDADDRTVVLDGDDVRTFERHYRPDREVGWCLYGSMNESQIRITTVVPANPIDQQSDRIEFTCVRETTAQFLAREPANLIGIAHSHPSKDRSRLSRVDTMTWGRTSPVVKVMGIYTKAGGAEFFTVRSVHSPLDKRVR